MSRHKTLIHLNLIVIASLLLAACATATPQVVEREVTAPPQVIRETVEVPVEVPRDVLVTPTAAPVDRRGGWLDQIVVVEEPSTEAAVARIDVGELDVYAFAAADPEVLARIQSLPNLSRVEGAGTNDEITFNPTGPLFAGTGKLNPFAVARIREAMNWLIDRHYIGQEIMGGLGVPRYLPINTGFPDYTRYIAKVRELEAKYAYDPEKAAQVITEEMEQLGAARVDGRWTYNGEPVEIIGLIRTEDERRDIGDYVGNQLENLGFTVRRDYKSAAEASPIWLAGDPNDGLYHYYTGGWVTTIINRDLGANFDFYFTPRGRSNPLWQNYTPAPEFDEVSDRLFRNDFQDMAERGRLFERALELAMEDSSRIWVVDELSYSPVRAGTLIAADLAGGVQGAWLWPFTLRKEGQVGGALTLANASILTDPWNPIAGSNWVYDAMLQRGTGDREVIPDPYTGLAWPQRIERMELFIKDGLPVTSTLDWVQLEFVPQNDVPADAWIDWDAAAQQFITVGEKHPEGLTANARLIVHYPENLYDLKWHDGSSFSLADIVMLWILAFDQSKPESALYDESTVPFYESLSTSLKGLRIVQEDPLVIEYYTDQYFLDAELNVSLDNTPFAVFFPYYTQGPGAWHNLSLGILAEANNELAFSSDKANKNEVEWMSYIGGPSLAILEAKLNQAATEGYLPYAPTLGQYLTADQVAARYANLQEWYRRHGHFWVGTGAYYLDRVFPVEGTVILKHFADYPDPVSKWAGFSEPRLAVAELDGPGRVTINSEAVYDVFATFKGAPYPQADIEEVKYLVFDATGALAATGQAEAVADGQWQITLSPEITGQLEAGSNQLEVAVVSKLVSIPSFASFEFVTAP